MIGPAPSSGCSSERGDGRQRLGPVPAASPDGPPHPQDALCRFCGLPVRNAPSADEAYCCFGCRVAASLAAADGEEGQARWAMTRLGLAIFFAMNVMVFSILLWSQDLAPPAAVSVGTSAATASPLTSSSPDWSAVWFDLARYAALLFTLPVVLLLGGPLGLSAWQEIRGGRTSQSTLLLTGVVASLAYSVYSLSRGGHVYFEVACAILVAVTLGRWLEATARLRTTEALRGLKRLMPDRVRKLVAGQPQWVPAENLTAGDLFRVLPGERVAADSLVVGQQAAIDPQAITGESLPVVRGPGMRVPSGCLVLDGPLDLLALAPAGEGTLARLIAAVHDATLHRGRIERLVDRISRLFLPVVALVALGTFTWHSWHTDWPRGMLAGLAVLAIACPCALGLATPLALWVAIGRAAQAGVLIRSGDALIRLACVRTVCFDKTGTLSTGETAVTHFLADPDENPTEVLAIAGSLAHRSNHPLARAVAAFVSEQGIHQIRPAEQVRQWPGRGIEGRLEHVAAGRVLCHSQRRLCSQVPATEDVASRSKTVTALLGARRWLESRGLRWPHGRAEAPPGQELASEVYVGWEDRIRGCFWIADQVRPEANQAIAVFKDLGIKCLLLTGDSSLRAVALAETLGLQWQADLLPEAKLAAVRNLAASGPVAMVGDGINDAPALAGADVGIAMAQGTDLAQQTAEICLLSNDLRRLPWLWNLAVQTTRTVRWNLVWAFGYNLVGVGLAAAGWLHPVIAAVAMTGSSLLVVTNSLRLARLPLDTSGQEKDR